ncbi:MULTISPECIES: hypothetical protein [unclassified Luteimonas]
MAEEKNGERVLGRTLAVEETEIVSGAVTSPGDDGQTSPQADAGTGCIGNDDFRVASGLI